MLKMQPALPVVPSLAQLPVPVPEKPVVFVHASAIVLGDLNDSPANTCEHLMVPGLPLTMPVSTLSWPSISAAHSQAAFTTM